MSNLDHRDLTGERFGVRPITNGHDRLYLGLRVRIRNHETATVTVIDGSRVQPLKHIVKHSPTGVEWGYFGSGPADLALSLLVDAVGHEPSPWCYQAFKTDVVVALDADTWVLSRDQIVEWFERFTTDTQGIDA